MGSHRMEPLKASHTAKRVLEMFALITISCNGFTTALCIFQLTNVYTWVSAGASAASFARCRAELLHSEFDRSDDTACLSRFAALLAADAAEARCVASTRSGGRFNGTLGALVSSPPLDCWR